MQFSRSIGAAFGTALVATVLFAFLALKNPGSGPRVRDHGQARARVGPGLPPAQLAIVQADIGQAFRAAFLTMAVFSTGGFFLALTNPLRRI